MSVEVSGFLGLVLLICVVYAIVKTLQSSAGTGGKGHLDCGPDFITLFGLYPVVTVWSQSLVNRPDP